LTQCVRWLERGDHEGNAGGPPEKKQAPHPGRPMKTNSTARKSLLEFCVVVCKANHLFFCEVTPYRGSAWSIFQRDRAALWCILRVL